MSDDRRVSYDPERVIAGLARRLAEAHAEVARLEAIVAALLAEQDAQPDDLEGRG